MSNIQGTHLNVQFIRVVDGDTIEVSHPSWSRTESLRILSLDTEESFNMGSKPVTPWGLAAKQRAKVFFMDAQEVTIEFPGTENVDTCLQKYRGNFGRLLVYVHHNGVDFQQTMIKEGYSPYFNKYGNAVFHHQRYLSAERDAQQRNVGVWDQQGVNDAEYRNYALLGTWWNLRARIIDEYRAIKPAVPTLLNTRNDYEAILAKAANGETITVFTELSGLRRVGGVHGLISYGSDDKPFNFFIPYMDGDEKQELRQLLFNRYIAQGESYTRRSYAYITGELQLYNGTPQMKLTHAEQVQDSIAVETYTTPTIPTTAIRISALQVNPTGRDYGNEYVKLKNTSNDVINLDGWFLQDMSGKTNPLSGLIEAQQERKIMLEAGNLTLNNTGDDVLLFKPQQQLVDKVSYTQADINEGEELSFNN